MKNKEYRNELRPKSRRLLSRICLFLKVIIAIVKHPAFCVTKRLLSKSLLLVSEKIIILQAPKGKIKGKTFF